VPDQPTAPRRLLTAARWPVGVLATSWSYLWRTTPLHRRELDGTWDADAPPPIPAGVDRDGIQGLADGAGTLLHRRYRARILGAGLTAAELILRLGADPNRVAPRARWPTSRRSAVSRAGWRSATSGSCACRARGTVRCA
jgi:hypothetical protein